MLEYDMWIYNNVITTFGLVHDYKSYLVSFSIGTSNK